MLGRLFCIEEKKQALTVRLARACLVTVRRLAENSKSRSHSPFLFLIQLDNRESIQQDAD
jgi:hypothetical protein